MPVAETTYHVLGITNMPIFNPFSEKNTFSPTKVQQVKCLIKICINDVEIDDEEDFTDFNNVIDEHSTSSVTNSRFKYKLKLKSEDNQEGDYWVHQGMKVSLLKKIYSKRAKLPAPHVQFSFYSSKPNEGIVVDIKDDSSIGMLGLGPGSTLWVYQY